MIDLGSYNFFYFVWLLKLPFLCHCSKVKVRFKFTKAGGNRTAEDTKKLMQVIGAKEEDTPLLKFWMQGLSLQYRQHILTASKSSRWYQTSTCVTCNCKFSSVTSLFPPIVVSCLSQHTHLICLWNWIWIFIICNISEGLQMREI